MNNRLAVLIALIGLVLIKPAFSQTTQAGAATQPAKADGKLSVTRHEITVNGKALAYRATTGELTLKDEDGKAKAEVFFVAYELENGSDSTTRPAIDQSQRPIMFLFNGGPGAAAVWLHLGAVGPKVIQFDERSLPVGPPYYLVDNPNTWLTDTDLVFIDPVSTGYSRPAAGEKADQFHGVRQDIASVADFIRLYTTKYQRWASPKYIAGESYGTTRAAALAGFLADRYGIDANGIVLISSVLDFQTLSPSPGNDLPYVLYLPSYTAVAGYHHKLPEKLQADLPGTFKEAEQFAFNEYGPALALGAALPAERRKEIATKLADFTGLPTDAIDRADLRIDPGFFQKHLLGDGRTIIGRFDGRITAGDTDAVSNQPSYDPSLSRYFPAYASTFNDYVRRELKYENDVTYEVLTGNVQPWSFGQEGGGYLYVVDELQQAILQHPHLRVMFVSGRYDLATPFAVADYTINRLRLSPDLRKNISHVYFPAGHMVYHDQASARGLADGVKLFIGGQGPAATQERPASGPAK